MATPEPSSYDIGDRQQGNNLYRNKTLKIQENMDCKNQLFELYKKGLITENELTTALKEFTKVNEDFKELKKMQDIEAVAKDLYKSVASFTDMHGECGLITAFSKLLNDYCYMASNIQNWYANSRIQETENAEKALEELMTNCTIDPDELSFYSNVLYYVSELNEQLLTGQRRLDIFFAQGV